MATIPVSGDRAAWPLLFCCWLVAVLATLGSLFFSEVMALPPCVLCWYQRIFMFPLVIILTMAFFPFDLSISKYALALGVGGWCVALYHCLLFAGFIPESVQPCTQGVSCADAESQQIAGVPIPLLSLLAFTTIIFLLIAARKRISK